ncbi:hypothetical protein JCM8208_005252 [Rhodotorula glutinis]
MPPLAPLPPSPLPPHDPLLSQLVALYASFLPSLDWRTRQRVESASTSFSNDWARLLPEERERAVGALLGRWCAFQSDRRSLDPAELGYQKMCRTIKVVKSTPLAATHFLASLRGLAVSIERTFPRSSSGLLEQWKRTFFGEGGVTVSKLVRSDSGGWDAMRTGLETVPELVGILERVGDEPGLALPSPDLLLRQAHTASQSPFARFATFSTLLKDLATLYRARPPRLASLAAHDEHVSLVRAVLVLADHNSGADVFVRLGTEMQVEAVGKAREVVFEAARAGQETGRLPSLHVLIHELREALKPERSSSQHSLSPSLDYAASHVPRQLVWLQPHTLVDPPPEDDPSLSVPGGGSSVFFPESRAVHY